MRLILFTDNLGSGGAQRQLLVLGKLLAGKGHSVRIVTYHDTVFYQDLLRQYGIGHAVLESTRAGRAVKLAWYLRREKPDAVVAFQEMPALYAELASIGKRPWRLVVSERCAFPDSEKSPKFRVIRFCHRFADEITCNSRQNASMIRGTPTFRDREIRIIYNAVDSARFRDLGLRKGDSDAFSFVVLASHKPQKNFRNLAAAVKLLADRGERRFRIRWFGEEASAGCLDENRRILEEAGVSEFLSIEGPVRNTSEILNEADAMILPSLWEGLPNSVCEAMACGCPVLASNVSDIQWIVDDGKDGFLFDPSDPSDIASAIVRFMDSGAEKRVEMGKRCVEKAGRLFSEDRYLDEYEKTIYGK